VTTPLEGNIEVFRMPDVFVLLARSGATGALRLNRESGVASIFFRRGQVYDAFSSLTRDFIGQRLVDAKLITHGQLLHILDEQKRSGRHRVGELVIEKGMTSAEQLETFVGEQIQDTIFDVLQWDAGRFSFEEGESSDQDAQLQMTVEDLLMEAGRRVEEWEVIRRRIPGPMTILKMSPASPEGAKNINIRPDEWPLLVLADGTRTVAEIATATEKSEFEASRTLYGFINAGLLDVASTPAAAAPGVGPESSEAQPSHARTEPDPPVPQIQRVLPPADPTVTAELLTRLKAGMEAL
jgi:hypothetical protein